MNSWTAIVVIVALLVGGAIAWMYMRRRRTDGLRTQFGPEYEHELHEQGSRRRAEAELRDRAKRVKRLSLRPLPPNERSRYAGLWNEQQARFVDDPKADARACCDFGINDFDALDQGRAPRAMPAPSARPKHNKSFAV